MKIALVSRGFSSHKGGAERFTNSLCRQLLQAGHEVHLYCGEAVESPVPGIKTFKINFFGWISFLKILSFHWKAGAMLRKEKYDVIYGLCQFFPLNAYYAGGGVHKHWMKLRYPGRLSRWMKYLFSPVHLSMIWLEHHICNPLGSQHIITNSVLVKKHILSYYSFPAARIHVVYDGVDASLFNPGVKKQSKALRAFYKIDRKDIVLGFISNNWPRKGLDLILSALSKLPHHFKLVVAGRGNTEAYKNKMKTLRLTEDRVHFLGVMEEIQKVYALTDIFLLPTLYDPFAQVCREALACGIPVVTTPENGAAEIIKNHINGFVLKDFYDEDGLQHFLRSLTVTELQEMSKAASLSVQNQSWEENARQHEEVFKKIAIL